jgi:hypothetical protein
MNNKLTHSFFNLAWILAITFVLHSCSENSPEPDTQLMPAVELSAHDLSAKVNSPAQNKLLAQIRAATAKYHRIEVAMADGYELDHHCVARPGVGAMGYHAPNFGLVDIVVDPLMPEVLLYEKQANGRMQLVAVEYIVAAVPWDAQYDNPPMLGNKVFDDHRDFLAMGGPPFPHYQLHIWIWKNNPLGMYTPFNPKVSCDN